MNYANDILNRLIKIYDAREFKNSKHKKGVILHLNQKSFPEYFLNQSSYDEAIDVLTNKNYIKCRTLPHETVVGSIYLNLEYVNEIKELLGLESIDKKKKLLLEELEKYNIEPLISFRNMILKRIDEQKSIKSYLNFDYIDAIKAISYIENLTEDVYEMNLSNLIFQDSKKLHKLKSIIAAIYNFEGDIFKDKGIHQMAEYLYIKGDAILKVNNHIMDLSKLETSIGILLDELNKVEIINVSKVTTVENLTTYHDYISDGLIIYLGGFPTKRECAFLEKLKHYCNNFNHFGDIDYGGFMILNNLIENLGVKINPIKMDIRTLEDNFEYLTYFDDKEYLLKLENLLSYSNLNNCHEVINYLITHNCKLEQESIYNSKSKNYEW